MLRSGAGACARLPMLTRAKLVAHLARTLGRVMATDAGAITQAIGTHSGTFHCDEGS